MRALNVIDWSTQWGVWAVQRDHAMEPINMPVIKARQRPDARTHQSQTTKMCAEHARTGQQHWTCEHTLVDTQQTLG